MQNIMQDEIYSVSQLNQEVKFLLEDTFPNIWVEGEVSNFSAPGSGHWYFSLKDANAQVRCALFKGNQRHIAFQPKDGSHVLIKARVSLYPNRGDFQLIAEHMEERGEGKLRRAFEILKQKLELAGLFDPAHKKTFPPFPQTIGVVTSPTGAAIRDILHVLKRRYPSAHVIIYPCLVQGASAAPTIVEAIRTANQRKESDVLILARGGGSLEDLWPFNEEVVAQAIYASNTPIISGVGHEVDFTIADYVADLRAPTPSAAAEMITPDQTEILLTLSSQQRQLQRQIKQKLRAIGQHIEWMQKHLAQQHPIRRVQEKIQRLDFSEQTLLQLQRQLLSKQSQRLALLESKLSHLNPEIRIRRQQELLHFATQQLKQGILRHITKEQTALANAAGTLDALSPLNTLQRGFAIAQNHRLDIIKKADTVTVGEKITVKVMEGSLTCRVEEIH